MTTTDFILGLIIGISMILGAMGVLILTGPEDKKENINAELDRRIKENKKHENR